MALKTTKPTIRIGGFFSGIGSHISACQRLADRANFVYVFQCEFDERTAKANNVLHGDIFNLGDITTVDNIGGALAVDILYWTPPCQDISNAGKMAGNAKGSGTRSALAYEVPRILANTPESDRPKYLVMEEVPTMISKKFKHNFADLLRELSALGYRHEYGILNAFDCGVAQYRRRAFVISKLNNPAPKLPRPRPSSKRIKHYLEPNPAADYYLSEERLKKMVSLNENNAKKGVGYRFNPQTGDTIAKTITTREGGREYSNYLLVDPPKLIQVGFLDIKDYELHKRVYSPRGLCPTIRAASGGNAEPKIIDCGRKVRKLTEKECLMLQGFSAEEADALRNATENDKRLFPKSLLYQFAGNAVCVDCFVRITEQILNDMTAPRKDTLDSWL